ncbi:hypothetical protein EZV62_008244 [Acer yangbiense]|uniref:RING-type E3 ubiquitin transferase n=1 Tax=Acer yangbiense TaxID=1000413 RepID=A0A5C7IDI6_9ROSI|nr:hypothetical protein EZV62_008244 [Acer yangbiense]
MMFKLLYVKTHPGVLPFISPLMLVVLTLGHMMVLLLNFEAWFFRSQNRRTVLLRSGGWPKVFVAMVAFVLQFCLFKLLWSSRLAFHKSQKASLIVEKKSWAHNYGDHEADFYSIAWNVSIPLGCIFFVVILYFQQRFGGRCFVPRRFREVEGYEKILAVAGEE